MEYLLEPQEAASVYCPSAGSNMPTQPNQAGQHSDNGARVVGQSTYAGTGAV